ncbi:MAG: amidoligase family protein, partial [Deltaproteobacteria bacterium]
MKRWFRFFKFNFIPVFVLLISGAVQVFSDEKNPQQPSALDVWNQMVEQSFTQNPKPIAVAGTSGTITFGAEKEGSSGLITRIMGPQSSIFLQLLTRFNETPETHKQLFLVEFLSQFASGKSRAKTVTDSEGKSIPFELSDFKNIDYSKLSIEELEAKFKVWLERTGDQGFSFLKPSTRMQLFKGTFPGLSPNLNLDPKWNRSGINPVGNYAQWSPLYGPAQKYIDSAHNTGKGWEINFKKQNSYGEFEAMIDWFRKSLHNAGEDFEAPGHQRLVFPKRNLTPDQTQTQTKQLGELYKNIQAYIVLKGILGQTGIETSNHKSIIQDQSLTNDGHSSGRGVIRLENDRFKSNGLPTLSIELRSGTKSESTRRLVEQVVASRYAANDFSGLFFERNWVLIPSRQSLTAEDLVRRFGVSRLESQRALKALTERFHDGKTMPVDYLVPFWQWEQAPYLSLAKQEFIKDLTRAFIKKAASWENASQQTRQQALTSWIQASGLVDSLESYLIPSPPKTPVSKEAQNFHRARAELPHPVDVNKIDLGIEYTGRFPIKLSAVYDRDPSHPKASWIRTQYDLTPEERATLVRNLAELLGKKIPGSLKPSITELSEGSHGHSFQLAFELKDAQGRKWRIEWDGVGRDYDSKGTVIEESIRGGHVEIVTPKFTPSAEDISAVFESMKSLGLQPDHRSGGGHINIDLAPFENNPKSMARFIAKFLEHRGIISLMFQDPRRVRTGEPNEVSPSLIQALKSFNGTEEQLKQLLYNERFFNTRLGRKTQYVQLNLNAYFQDIIPSQFLNKDFDLKNAPWRENFSVEPHIRKAEMRLFNAPQTTHEAQAQIQLVRSLLDSALNDKTSVSGEVQPVQHEHYAQNPERAKKEFEKLMHDLELDPNIYETYLWDGMQTTRSFLESDSYLPLEKALASFPKQTQWGTAVQARSQSEAINSEEREWNPNAISKASKELQDTRKNLRDLETIKRTELPPQPGELTRELPSLPLEFGLSGTQIESLSKPQQLAVYYLRSLSHLSSKAEKKHAQTKLREMKQLENFGEILSETLRTPVQAGKIEFPLWLAKLVKPQPPFHEAIAILLSSPRSEVRDIAIANLKKMSSKQVVEFLNNNQYQLPEVLQNSDVALTILDLINHLPRRLSERNRD